MGATADDRDLEMNLIGYSWTGLWGGAKLVLDCHLFNARLKRNSLCCSYIKVHISTLSYILPAISSPGGAAGSDKAAIVPADTKIYLAIIKTQVEG
jgi:hypothetical protein